MTALAPVVDLAEHRQRVEHLVEQWRPLALKIARRMVGRTNNWSAVESAALVGLWQAARSFDEARDIRFQTWLDRKVRSAVKDELRSLDYHSRYWRERVNEAGRAEEELTASMRRHPTAAEVNAAVGLDQEDIRLICLQREMGSPLFFDAPVSFATYSGDLSLHEAIAAPEVNDEVEELERLIHTTLRGQQLEAVLRYLDGETLGQIGASWGVTESRVCQVMTKAKTRLREAARRAGLIEGGGAA